MTTITISGVYDSDDCPPPQYLNKHFKRIKNAVLSVIDNPYLSSIAIEYSDGDYSYEITGDELSQIRYAYHHSEAKPLWDLWLKRFDAIEKCAYP